MNTHTEVVDDRIVKVTTLDRFELAEFSEMQKHESNLIAKVRAAAPDDDEEVGALYDHRHAMEEWLADHGNPEV